MIEQLLSFKDEFIILAWVSFALLMISVVVIPFIIIRIPENYFHARYRMQMSKESQHPLITRLFAMIKNIIGFIFVILGILMLILPGQGILTILIGLFLMNFPGKYRLERRIVSSPKVLKALNWIRYRANKPPLMLE